MEMTYKEFIDNILETRGRFNCGEEYHERHHIVPRCMGGTNDEDNLIDLFAREHFEAHRLLALENPDNNSLTYAWWMMSHVKNDNEDRYELTPNEYEESKIAFIDSISGENHPNYGKHPTEETIQKLKESHIGQKAWNKGIPLNEDIKNYLSEINSGKNHPQYGTHKSQYTKDKISKSHSGENAWNYGKHLSDEHKRKISIANKGKNAKNKGAPMTESAKQKNKLSHKRLKILCIETGIIYESQREASKLLNIPNSSLRNAIKTGNEINGFHFVVYEIVGDKE